jgi:ATP-dependent DNA helicase RecG
VEANDPRELDAVERIRAALRRGESHFREFKSALEGSPDEKRARPANLVRRDIAEALVAFANADGGELLVGVEDDGRVTGVPHSAKDIRSFLEAPRTNVMKGTPLPAPEIHRVRDHDRLVLYYTIEKSTRFVHLTSDGRCVQRRDTETVPVQAERIQFERQEQLSRQYDREFLDGASVADLSDELVGHVTSRIAAGMSAEKVLQLLGLAEFDGLNVMLRRAALLLFGRDARRWHPRCEVRVIRVAGAQIGAGREYNVRSDETIGGPILRLLTDAWELLRPHLVETRLDTDGVFRRRILYPEDACREALTNAIAHRDYSIEGRGVEVLIFDDRMEVRSPGGLLSNVTLSQLRALRGVHESRNAMVARTLREVGYMQEMGEGIRRIYALMRASDLAAPRLSADLESFTITLNYESVYSPDAQRWLGGFGLFRLTSEEQKVVALGQGGAPFSPQQVRDELGIVDTEDYRRVVEQLQLKGLLESVGKGARRGRSSRTLKRYKIRLPEHAERHFNDLVHVLAEAVSPRGAFTTHGYTRAAQRLPEDSPYPRTGPQLRRTAQILELVDSDSRPLEALRTLLESQGG